jgi:hypothetical protein
MEASWESCVNDLVRIKYLIKSFELANIAFCIKSTSNKGKRANSFLYITVEGILVFSINLRQSYVIFMVKSI